MIYNHFFPRVGPYFGFSFAQTVSCAAFRLEGLLDVLTKFYLVLPEEDFRLLLCLKAEPALCFVSKFSKQMKVALFDSFCYFLLRPWHGTTRFKFPLFPHLPRRALWRLLAGAVTNGSVGDYGDCDRDLLLLWRGRFQPCPAEPLTTPRISLKLIEYDRISRFRNLSLWLL